MILSDPRRPCQPTDQQRPLDHFFHGSIIYVFEAALTDLSSVILMVNDWEEPNVLFVFHPSDTNQKLMGDLLEVDGVIFDDSFGPASPDHKWAYEKLKALHESGQMSVLRAWYPPKPGGSPTIGSTGASSTFASKSCVTEVSNSVCREHHRNRSTLSVDMKDTTAPESTKTPASFDSDYPKSSLSPSDQRLSPSLFTGPNTPSTPPSPSMQLLDTF
jgi:hypothetical protein